MMIFNFDCELFFVSEQFKKSLNKKIKLETIKSILIYIFNRNDFNIFKLFALITSITIINNYEFDLKTLFSHITTSCIKNDFTTLLSENNKFNQSKIIERLID